MKAYRLLYLIIALMCVMSVAVLSCSGDNPKPQRFNLDQQIQQYRIKVEDEYQLAMKTISENCTEIGYNKADTTFTLFFHEGNIHLATLKLKTWFYDEPLKNNDSYQELTDYPNSVQKKLIFKRARHLLETKSHIGLKYSVGNYKVFALYARRADNMSNVKIGALDVHKMIFK